MILPAQTIWSLCESPMLEFTKRKPIISPFTQKGVFNGMSYGLSSAGYDIRVKQDIMLLPDKFTLASAIEHFCFPDDVLGVVHDKSSLARRGLSVFNTVIEPGWTGYLTLELRNQGQEIIHLPAGSPVAQIIFHRLEAPTFLPYRGKYQDQADAPVPAIQEQPSCCDDTTTQSKQFSLSLDLLTPSKS
jgi:dCTP deaminase